MYGLLYSSVLYSTVLFIIVLYFIVQYYIVQYFTLLYSNVQLSASIAGNEIYHHKRDCKPMGEIPTLIRI